MKAGRLFPITRKPGRPTCVMVPGAGGGVVPYLRLAGFLGQTYNVYAVRAAGLVPDEQPEDTVPAMTEGVLAALEPGGLVPDAVFGWSMGGTVAWEVCATFAERGHHPDLVLVDCSPFRIAVDPDTDQGVLDVIIGMLGPRPDEATVARVKETYAAHVAALRRFDTTREYGGRVLLLACTGQSDLIDRTAGIARWQALAPELKVEPLDGNHFQVFDPDRLDALCAPIGRFLGVADGVPA